MMIRVLQIFCVLNTNISVSSIKMSNVIILYLNYKLAVIKRNHTKHNAIIVRWRNVEGKTENIPHDVWLDGSVRLTANICELRLKCGDLILDRHRRSPTNILIFRAPSTNMQMLFCLSSPQRVILDQNTRLFPHAVCSPRGGSGREIYRGMHPASSRVSPTAPSVCTFSNNPRITRPPPDSLIPSYFYADFEGLFHSCKIQSCILYK